MGAALGGGDARRILGHQPHQLLQGCGSGGGGDACVQSAAAAALRRRRLQAAHSCVEVAQDQGPRPYAHLQHGLARLRWLGQAAQANHGACVWGSRWQRCARPTRRRRLLRLQAQPVAKLLEPRPGCRQHRLVGHVHQKDQCPRHLAISS